MDLELLIRTYGYPALLVGTLLEGETVLVIAGFAAHRGYLALPWVLLVAFAGSFIADQWWFFLGRTKGRQYLAAHPRWERRAAKPQALLERHQLAVVLGFRFLYGLRTITPLVIGAGGFNPARFLLLNALGAALWAVVLGGAGYLFGQTLEVVLEDLGRWEEWILLLVVLVGLALWGRHLRRNRRENPRS